MTKISFDPNQALIKIIDAYLALPPDRAYQFPGEPTPPPVDPPIYPSEFLKLIDEIAVDHMWNSD